MLGVYHSFYAIAVSVAAYADLILRSNATERGSIIFHIGIKMRDPGVNVSAHHTVVQYGLREMGTAWVSLFFGVTFKSSGCSSNTGGVLVYAKTQR